MSKYKVGDKVVMEITDKFKNAYDHEYYSVLDSIYSTDFIDEKTEPLSTHTEPLERKNENKQKRIEKLVDRLHNQAAEITRLLAENKELKEDKAVLNAKIDAYELYGDQHEEEYNQAFNQGAEAAWELARKIVLKNGYTSYDLHEIFNCCGSHQALEDFTYQEAAEKVVEWEKAKEEIKVGDIVKIREGNNNDLCVLCMSTDKKYYNAVDGYGAVYYLLTKEMIAKTGRHIDVDSFLKQIGGEQE